MENEVDDQRIDKLEKDVEKLDEKYDGIAITQAGIAEKMNCALDALDEVKVSIKSLELVPSKRWESLIASLLSSVVAVLVGFVFGRFI